MSKFVVIRDTREKRGNGWFFEEDDVCAGTIEKGLKTGDYSIKSLEKEICIERKRTIDEFATNCVKQAWYNCMERMKNYKHAYLICEFSWQDVLDYPTSSKIPKHIREKYKLRIPSLYIQKVIVSARTKFNIHVIFCGNKVKAEQCAYRILKRYHEITRRKLLRNNM